MRVASLIPITFETRNTTVLTKAFVTDVRPLLQYCTSALSLHTASNIESCQRWFTKRIKGMSGMQHNATCLPIWSLYRLGGLSVTF